MPSPQTLVESFGVIAARHPERLAFREGNTEVTYGQARARIGAFVARLDAAGVARGDRVLIAAPNSAAVAIAYLGTHAAGAIAMPVGPDVPREGIAQILQDGVPTLRLAEGVELPDGVTAEALGTFTGGEGSWVAPRCTPEDAADLLFTTGTTGRKKGVLLGHDNVLAAATNINAFVGTQQDDVEVLPIPLSHSFGLGRLRCQALVGHTLVLEPGMKNPARLLKRMVEVRATGLALVPAGFALLRRLVRKRIADVAEHLRYIEIGSAPMDAAEREWLLEYLPNTRICHHFGLTEASRSAFCELREDAGHAGSIGRATPGVAIRVLGDDGMPVPDGDVGELVVQGGQVMREYWQNREQTEATFVDGWLRTGDEGYRDADGYLFLKGRKQDVINVGGLKVAPADVDQVLRRFDGVLDAACAGVPDERGITGQAVKAFVVLEGELDEEALTAFLHAHLAEHEVPRLFQRVDTIPRTVSGKVQRHLLRGDSP